MAHNDRFGPRPRAPRLTFWRWSEDDHDLAWQLWGDPRVTALFARDPLTREQVDERLRASVASDRAYGVQYWPLFAGDVFVGCGGLRPRDPEKRVYDLGYHLLPSAWGHGYATEAAVASVAFAFGELGASALFAGHHPENHASRKVLLKAGFHHTHDELFPPTGRMHLSYWQDAPTR
jgi:ribosomal-protein-alanine N-acetyltransferase